MKHDSDGGNEIEENGINCRYTDEIVCPYCGHEFQDSYEYFGKSGDEAEIECTDEDCEKKFRCSPDISVTYVSSRPKGTP
jgi:hypothetical protein